MNANEKIVEMTCIRCPLGCALKAVREDNGEITVTGNTCPRGAQYAIAELTAPMRTVTSTVRVKGQKGVMCSVKTKTDIPKGKMAECVMALKETEAEAPVRIGDVILANVADTGVDIVATCNVG